VSILDAGDGTDTEIRPQDDLFGHVNGRWLREAEIPDDQSGWGSFMELRDRSDERVRTIVEELAAGAAGGAELAADARKVGDVFASFMDADRVEALGLEPVRPVLAAIGRLTDLAGVAAFVGGAMRAGVHGPVEVEVDTDDRSSGRHLLKIEQAGLGLPDASYYSDDRFAEVRERYLAYLTRLLELADRPDPAGAAAGVVEVEARLAEGHWAPADTRDVQRTYNLTTLDELRAACPSFDWVGFAGGLGGGVHDAGYLFGRCCVREPSYLAHLSAVLAEVPVERWLDWLRCRVLEAYAPYLPEAFVAADFELHERVLAGIPRRPDRWRRGVQLVQVALGEAVGREYVDRYFPPGSKAMVEDIVAHLVAAYRESISRLDWMTDATRQRALAKLAAMHPRIGYPPRFRDHSALRIRRDDLFGNVVAAYGFESDRQLAKLGAPVDRDEWRMFPQTVNAYYTYGTNQLTFPAGILQAPFFDPAAGPARNYGGIGAVIGHEIGHGFDDQGSRYDATGNLSDWWTPADAAAFRARAAALIAQYDRLEPRDLPAARVNGALTVGENIGDLGGLTIAYHAFLLATGGTADPAAGRRMFLAWGLIWRGTRRPEYARRLLTVDPHAPMDLRANIVRNLDEFHQLFGTAPGDGLWLDPADRVRIW
jgi:endothelin-converting enzyme/putative endopeptidase